MLLTIAMAAYNCEEYLPTNVEQLMSIKSDEVQILLVDDGSTDRTGLIFDQLQKRDHRIVIIHKENGGLADTRNVCISKADGEYLWFIDADDQIVLESIDDIIDKLKTSKSDVIFSNVVTFDQNKKIGTELVFNYDVEFIKKANKNELLQYLWGKLDMTWGVWRHIFNVEFLRKNQCCFDTNLAVYEDCDFLLDVVTKASKFDALNGIIYRYYTDITSSISHKKLMLSTYTSGYEVSTKWFRFFQDHEEFADGRNGIMLKFAYGYSYISGFIVELDISEQRKAIRLFKKNMDIVEYYETHKEN